MAVDKFEMVGHADIALLDKPMLTLDVRCTGLLDTESLTLTATPILEATAMYAVNKNFESCVQLWATL